MHASLQKILDMPSNQIDRAPKPAPQGWYIATVDGQPEEGQANNDNKTDYYDFDMRLVEAYKDVDDDALGEYLTGLDGSTRSVSECHIKHRIYVTPKSVGRFLQFLDHLEGLKPSDVGEEASSVAQRIAGVNGRTCLIHVKHEPWQSGEGVSARIDQTMIYDEE